MTGLGNIDKFYFVGIGGIGMSALARYFASLGKTVAGYDRTSGPVTSTLQSMGCNVIFDDDPAFVPEEFRNPGSREKILVVYTPAIPSDSRLMEFFRKNGYTVSKRSEVLGRISKDSDTLAIAGTHGKTTVSTMTAHLLKQSHVDCSAFLGGISKNYESNMLVGRSSYMVVEADEFDRSFLQLDPLVAIVTSLDADHLDIYGDRENMIAAYNEFCSRVRKGGMLIVNSMIRDRIVVPEGVECLTYGMNTKAAFRSFDIRRDDEFYIFSIETPSGKIEDLKFPFPGMINIENFTAAIAAAQWCGVSEQEVRQAVFGFRGVRRRFDIRINQPGLTYIDDYAHHPEEIRACITAVKEYFSGRRITGIFQPHLFTRTRDHAEGFAAILDELDEPILLPVYPAREKPIEGVGSEMILEKMRSPRKKLLSKSDIPGKLDVKNIDVLVTIGAGDIDTLVSPIEDKLRKERTE